MNSNVTVQQATVPPELQRALPRDVTLNGSGIAVLVLALLMIFGGFACGAWFSSVSKDQTVEYAAERADAVAAQGRVTEVQRLPGKEDRWRVRYSFEVDDQVYVGATSMRRIEARRYQPDADVQVMYVRSDPHENWVSGHDPKPLPAIVATLIGITPIMIGGLLLLMVQRQRAMLEQGRAVMARVTDVRRYSTGKSSGVRVRFDFTMLEGFKREGRANTTVAAAPALGSDIVVLYDANKPQRTVLYPLSLVRVRGRR
jgi:hypothetical protein